MRVHQHWRGRIHDTLRQRRTRLSADYIQRNLDRFDLLLPKLSTEREVFMHRRDISALTNGEWSEASIGKWLNHLERIGVVELRNAGSRGLTIKLGHDLTKSPFPERRSDVGRVVDPDEVIPGVEADGPLREDVEFDPMPTTPTSPQQFNVPEDDDYCTNLSLDMTLGALDTVSHGLLRINLDFAKEFTGQKAAKIYAAQEAIALAVNQLSRIRSAIGAGENSDLEEIVGPHTR